MMSSVLHLAHLRWFTEGVRSIPHPLSLTQGIAAVGMVVGGFFAASQVARRTRPLEQKLDGVLAPFAPWARTVVGLAMGAGLLMACRAGDLVTPEHHAISSVWLFVEHYAGVSWVLGFLTPIGSLLALSLYVPMVQHTGPQAIIEHMELLGAAVFLGLGGRGPWSLDRLLELAPRVRDTGTDAHGRMFEFTGLSLVVVGLNEKLFDLGMAEAFLRRYPWNFLARFGVADSWFITCIGASEVLIGLLIACNVVSRLTAAAVLGMMTLTAILLGPLEVAGHLFAAGLVACIWLRPRTVAAAPGAALASEEPELREGAA